MKRGYERGSVRDILGGLPRRRFRSVLIALPLHIVLEAIASPARVENRGDFVFGVAFDLDWWRWWLSAIGDCIGVVDFEERDVEDGVYESHSARQSQSVRVAGNLAFDGEWT